MVSMLKKITLSVRQTLEDCTLFCPSKPHSCVSDTSSPLTCSACSRVFMTARGLLHHVQQDHRMNIYLQKGPLIIPDSTVRPPPAHSTVNGKEFVITDSQANFQLGNKTVESFAKGNDEPTDLSMSCSNSSAKTTVKCNENECKIIIGLQHHLERKQEKHSNPAVPKKRKFIFPGRTEQNVVTASTFPTTGLSNDCSTNKKEEILSQNSDSDQGDQDNIAVSDVSINVTASYEKNALCCISLKSEKKDTGNTACHARKSQSEESSDTLDCLSSDEELTRDNMNTVTPVSGQTEINKSPVSSKPGKADSQDQRDSTRLSAYSSHDEVQSGSSQYHSPRFIVGSTLEQNIDQLIRASLSSDTYTDDFDLFESDPGNSSSTLYKESIHSSSTPSIVSSPLVLCDENTIKHSFSTFDLTLPFLGEEEKSKYSLANKRLHISSLDFLSSQATDPSAINAHQSVHLKSKPVTTLLHGLSEACPMETSSADQHRFTNHSKHEAPYPPIARQSTRNQVVLDESLSCCAYVSQSLDRAHTRTPSRSVASTPNVPYGETPKQEVLNMQNENDVYRKSPSRSVSEQVNGTIHGSLDISEIERESSRLANSRLSKKRRYPTSRPFKCAHCDQAFNQRIHLKKHMSKHTGVKPFKCQQCDYSTVERSHLKVHYRIHTGEKPYRCMYCDYATAQNSTLKIHLKRHHEGLHSAEGGLKRNSLHQIALVEEDNSVFQETYLSGMAVFGQHPRERSTESETVNTTSTAMIAQTVETEPVVSKQAYNRLANDMTSPSRDTAQYDTCSSQKFTTARYVSTITNPESVVVWRSRDAKEDEYNISVHGTELSKCQVMSDHQKDNSKELNNEDRLFVQKKSQQAMRFSHPSVNYSSPQKSEMDEDETHTASGIVPENEEESAAVFLKPQHNSQKAARQHMLRDRISSYKDPMNMGAVRLRCFNVKTDSSCVTKTQYNSVSNNTNSDKVNVSGVSFVPDKHSLLIVHKPETVISDNQVDDDCDDSDLGYSPGLPSVSIPDKAFVRG